jgi:hypothetical protein
MSVVILALAALFQQQPRALIDIVVSDSGPVARAQIVVNGATSETSQDGRVMPQLAPGEVQITVVKEGFNPVTVTAVAVLGQPQVVQIALERGVATLRRPPFSVTGTYTYVHSREGVGADRGEVPLTPRHSAGLVAMWEKEDRGRIGVEAYFTGRQRLEDNPFRAQSAAYVLFGGLVERRFGRIRVFVNAEDLGDVRQTRFDPLVRPTQAVDGRWTVDGWAPLDGRVINGGVRIAF